MQFIRKIKNWRWYNLVGYALNRTFVTNSATVHTDLYYGQFNRQVLDLYVPHKVRKSQSLIVFVHGGSWQRGAKEDYVFLAQSFAKEGFYVAVINYQFAPEFPFPHFVNDTILAVNWLQHQKQASRFEYDPNNIILMGHSAGAFNVLSALYPNTDINQSLELSSIKAVIGIAGPYSFEHRGDPVAKFAFDQIKPPEKIMPSYFVKPNTIPHLLLIAEKDNLVGHYNTERMTQALLDVGNQVAVKQIKRTQHISIIATVATGLDRFYTTKKEILSFIEQQHL